MLVPAQNVSREDETSVESLKNSSAILIWKLLKLRIEWLKNKGKKRKIVRVEREISRKTK